MNWHIPNNLSFENALQLTETLIDAMAKKQLKDYEIEEIITTLVSSKNGGRGFFVIYLTTDLSIADNPSEGVINALKTSSDNVSELLVKNLAMSSAMVITHRRNNDEQKAQGSDRVCKRTINLIKQMNLELTQQQLQELNQTIINNEGSYQIFLEKWGYDQEQKHTIKNKIEQLLS
ncbi:hypothetical protein [Crocosphaera chwakensis]|uniref:Uncharacterized protein n=1 Tax=Crocosphaera chwakensis CCY0110 TaxID=391612 RepID=A3IUI3_9CHRO|nr:hypothetical protein [Crocosphaera chwakensis]EAZ89870.1 hypothetical protein CY0110_06279 [Crocosphaera chwakensis CCY0110]